MQQVKIFKSLENDIVQLEQDVNAWLRESGAKVTSLTGNIAPQSEMLGDGAGGMGQMRYAPSDVCLFLLYETD